MTICKSEVKYMKGLINTPIINFHIFIEHFNFSKKYIFTLFKQELNR